LGQAWRCRTPAPCRSREKRDYEHNFSTVALGTRYASLSAIVIGTTLGMMAAKIPAVFSGERLTRFVPLAKMRFLAAALFSIFGVLVLSSVNIGITN